MSSFDKRPNGRLERIDNRRLGYSAIETLFFGLSLGSVLVLAAIGLAITFGVMGVINMAHGELLMIGAYTTYVVQTLMPQHVSASLACVGAGRICNGGCDGRADRANDHQIPLRSAARDAVSRRSESAWCCSSWCARSSRR